MLTLPLLSLKAMAITFTEQRCHHVMWRWNTKSVTILFSHLEPKHELSEEINTFKDKINNNDIVENDDITLYE